VADLAVDGDGVDPAQVLDWRRRRPAWMWQGACRTAPIDVDFFPGRYGDWRTPVAVCATCPVFDECREWSLGIEDLQGIWAGLGESGRGKLRRRRGG
jgi:WhiB family redox-sensing transcriptional regulator